MLKERGKIHTEFPSLPVSKYNIGEDKEILNHHHIDKSPSY